MAEPVDGQTQVPPHNAIPYGNYTWQGAPQPEPVLTKINHSPDDQVQWTCPMCLGPVQTQDLRQPTIVGLLTTDPVGALQPHEQPVPKSYVIGCNCGIAHVGAPSTATGCGYGVMTTLDTAGHITPPTALDTDLRPWAAQMAAQELSALSDLRSSASTWAGSLATALGAVSLSALLTGSKTFSGLAPAPAHVGEVFFVVAGAATVLATAMAFWVATVTKMKPYGADPRRYRQWSTDKVRDGVLLMHASQGLAAFAAGLALAAAGVLFFGSHAATTPTSININGTTLCAKGSGSSHSPSGNPDFQVTCDK